MRLPVELNVQPCLYQGWADNTSNEEDADLSNLLQFHSCLTYEGQVVVDPFVGSGTTAVAAKGLMRAVADLTLDKLILREALEGNY
jgi:hypothetical protein